ncbi:hypothetical protein [Roseibium sp. SCP14]|uniref:hypothetical protein n=1 Tax=Roseibium sp. SCP14 TaxID=3141375 RepID=UPI003337B913
MKSLLKFCVFAILGGGGFVLPAHACQPMGLEYDDPFAPEALAIIGKVTAFNFEISERGICVKTDYDIRENLTGAYNGPLEVEVCYQGEEDTRSFDEQMAEWTKNQAEMNRVTGNYEGAEVVAVLTKATPVSAVPPILSQTEYRPAITSCWFIHQVNLGEMSDEQKASYLAKIRTSIAERKIDQAEDETGNPDPGNAPASKQ